jgi:hypothetical protein
LEEVFELFIGEHFINEAEDGSHTNAFSYPFCYINLFLKACKNTFYFTGH